MKSPKTPLVSTALLLAAFAMPAGAASSTASSASDSASSAASSGSESLKKSSESSTKTTAAMNSGDYEVVEVARVAERPGTVRLRLQAVVDRSADGEFFLYLPQQTFEQTQLASGQLVAARQRPYGVEFAHGDSRRAFFLVIDDDWARDLPSHVVTL
ncbi:MAG: hypothetical protein ABI702_16550 [Burkholderiales bacterium]